MVNRLTSQDFLVQCQDEGLEISPQLLQVVIAKEPGKPDDAVALKFSQPLPGSRACQAFNRELRLPLSVVALPDIVQIAQIDPAGIQRRPNRFAIAFLHGTKQPGLGILVS